MFQLQKTTGDGSVQHPNENLFVDSSVIFICWLPHSSINNANGNPYIVRDAFSKARKAAEESKIKERNENQMFELHDEEENRVLLRSKSEPKWKNEWGSGKWDEATILDRIG